MSQPDVHTTYSEPCPCGAGRVVIELVDYNQMYGGTDTRGRIDCATCRAAYCFDPPYRF